MNKEEARPDIHGYEERVRRYLVFIAESSIPEEDKKAIVEFSEVLRAQGLHIGRVMKYLYPPEGLRGEHHRAFTPTSSSCALDGWISEFPPAMGTVFVRRDLVVLGAG